VELSKKLALIQSCNKDLKELVICKSREAQHSKVLVADLQKQNLELGRHCVYLLILFLY
jgi:diphthamide synthase subunit DPH2